MRWSLRWLWHSAVIHPVCGVLWFFGYDADALHDRAIPKGEEG